MNDSSAWRNTLLRAIVGSEALGLATEDSDRDELGVIIEPIHEVVNLGIPFEQFQVKTDDLDITLYSLRKFCRLAAKGNPTLLMLLFVPHSGHTRCDARGHALQENAHWFVSKKAGPAFLGYMQAQRKRLLGPRTEDGSPTARPKEGWRRELVEKYGYDTKYAMHLIRLGLQGIELLQTGRLTLPLGEEQRRLLMAIRTGEWSLDRLVDLSERVEAELVSAYHSSRLPESPNIGSIETWLQKLYLHWWKASDIDFLRNAFAEGIPV